MTDFIEIIAGTRDAVPPKRPLIYPFQAEFNDLADFYLKVAAHGDLTVFVMEN